MKNINDIVVKQNSCVSADVIEQKKQVQQIVAELFSQLAVIKPAINQWIDKQMGADKDFRKRLMKNWMIALHEEQITPEQVKRALKHCVRDPNPFMPAIGQFLAWCREPLNKSEILAAWSEFVNRRVGDKWNDLRVRETLKRLNVATSTALITQNNDDVELSKSQFYGTFDEVCREVESGQLVLVEQIAIENQENKTVAGYEQRKENIAKSKGYAEFKQMLNK